MTTVNSPPSDTPGFAVTIVACGPLANGMVFAVAVSQPVQSWTVLRSHADFAAFADALAEAVSGLPSCPMPKQTNYPSAIVASRDEMQEWLTSVLMIPAARESIAVRNFLTLGANTVLPQYENVNWTQFNHIAPTSSPPSTAPVTADGVVVQVDDMEMADMFMADEDAGGAVAQDDHDDEDDDFIPAASERYKPTDEAVTDEDELDILQGDVEMIEDIGSLAQSLGASHLGRSLNLQAQLRNNAHPAYHRPVGGGLNVGGAAQQGPSVGGLGGAIAQAATQVQSNDSFNRRPLDSAARLDSFKMIRVIGRGSFGKVFLVREIKSSQIYALKVLRKDNIIRRNQVEHTKTERSVLGYVRHPFIVGMNMAFQSRDKLYFVLDYCAGGELFFHLGKEGRFSELRARFYAAEIVLAISYVHSLDIIYRDLKPENVLLDKEGHIRLTDFGLSKEGISNSSSGATSFCGTPEYLAPEILNRQGHGRAVDWWSLGALLYEMLTGLPPFYCSDRERLFEKIKRSELVYPESLSRPAVTLLKGLLTKDPKRRLGSGPNDADDIKVHEFFTPIDWNKLMTGEIPAPWRPQISGVLDTSQFDKEFTSMPVFSPQSMQRAPGFGTTPSDTHFEGFTFTNSILYGPHGQQRIGNT